MKWRHFAVISAIMSAVLVGGAVPAYATNQVGFMDCWADQFAGHYFRMNIHNPQGNGFTVCYANAGDIDIPSYSPGTTESFSSGNNAGYFDYEPGDGSRYRHTFGKGESKFQHYGQVVHLHIN